MDNTKLSPNIGRGKSNGYGYGYDHLMGSGGSYGEGSLFTLHSTEGMGRAYGKGGVFEQVEGYGRSNDY